MLALNFGDSTTDVTAGMTADQQAQVPGFISLGGQLQQAEADVWSSYNNLVAIANSGSDPSFASIPVNVVNAYNQAQAQLVMTCQLYIDAQSQADGTAYTPTPPPQLVVASSGLGATGSFARVAPRAVTVVFGPKGSQRSVPLSGPEAKIIGHLYSAGASGLGIAPLTVVFVLLLIAITAAGIAIIINQIDSPKVAAHHANVALAAHMAAEVKSATSAASAMQAQCIAAGGDPMKCTQAAGTAMNQTVKNIPKPPTSPDSTGGFWATVGIVAVAAVAGGAVLWYYQRRHGSTGSGFVPTRSRPRTRTATRYMEDEELAPGY